MSEPQNRGTTPIQNITKARNLAAHLLLNRNFYWSPKTTHWVRNLSREVDLSTLGSDAEQLKHEQIKMNCEKAVMDKLRYKITGLDVRHKECLRRRDEIGDWFENIKPDKTMLVKFGVLFSNFEIFTEQTRLIEMTTKIGRETSPFLTEKMVETMEKSLDTFDNSIAKEYTMDEIYENIFDLRDCCHGDLQQICLTLIRLERDEEPIYVSQKPSRYQPMDMMFMTQMLTIEKNMEAAKYLALTSANHHVMNVLRCKIVGRSRGLPAYVKLPLPNVPMDNPNMNIDHLCEIKSQNYLNHFNEISNLVFHLAEMDDSVQNDITFLFMQWLESLRRMSVVVLGNLVESVLSLDEDSLKNNNDWQRSLYFVSVWSRLCCLLLNIHKILALYVDKKLGMYGKIPYNSSIFDSIFATVFHYLDQDYFNREKVEDCMLQLQTEVIALAAEYSPIEDPLCSKKYTEAPDVTDYHQKYNYEPTTLCPENFPPIMRKYSDAMFHQLAVEKAEIHRLAAQHECLRMFYAKELIDHPGIVRDICAPRVNSFCSDVTEYLSSEEVAKAFDEGKDDVMDHPACEHISIDLATMARNVAGDTPLSDDFKTTAFTMFMTRFRLYVGTRLEEMRQTSRISFFFFAFMWQSVIVQRPVNMDEEAMKLNAKTALGRGENIEKSREAIIDLSDKVQSLVNNWALLAAERFLSYADSLGLYTLTATKTPMEALIYRWLINKYFEPSRQFFYRHDPDEKKYGEKGILFSEFGVTAPLTAAEEIDFAEMNKQLQKKYISVDEIDAILDINEENTTEFYYSAYVNHF